jgi:DNA polymerase-4
MPMTRKIIHIDCDCFYAAVETRDEPGLRGRPVAVGGDPRGRGVIAACNYEARAYGAHSAMASAHALRLCPELVMLRPDFDKYRRISRDIHAIFQRYTDRIEPLSLDEAYLDVTETDQLGNSATRIADAIRDEVRRELNLTVSAGVAPNKFLAKVASDWRKPDGRFVIPPDQVDAFVQDLPVECIQGVGRVTADKLRQQGVRTCGDLQAIPRVELAQNFGVFGERLYHFARGDDDRPVKSERRRKSVSVEKTYSRDLHRPEDWRRELPELLDKLRERLERLDSRYLVQALIAKVRYRDFALSTCESAGSRMDEEAYAGLLDTLWHRRELPARLLGIGVRLRDTTLPMQPDLFPEEQERALAQQRKKDL